jgi:hypothetical protein
MLARHQHIPNTKKQWRKYYAKNTDTKKSQANSRHTSRRPQCVGLSRRQQVVICRLRKYTGGQKRLRMVGESMKVKSVLVYSSGNGKTIYYSSSIGAFFFLNDEGMEVQCDAQGMEVKA